MSRVLIVTGSRKGIGKDLAEYYLKKGYQVIGCSRNESSIENDKYLHYCLNVSNEKEVVKMIKDVAKRFKRIDILLNNAGIASMNHFMLTPLKTVQNIFNTNFNGTFLFSREVAKVMIKNKSGKIVNFATVATPLKLEGESIYAASKAAIENFTKLTAYELGEFGITINAIGPTPIPTDLIKSVPENKIKALLNRQAIKRIGSFDDIVNAVDFFIDEKSDFITGQILYLGGVNN